MIVLKMSLPFGPMYLKKCGSVSAKGCQTLDDAKTFKSEADAEKYRDKYVGTGIGIEGYKVAVI